MRCIILFFVTFFSFCWSYDFSFCFKNYQRMALKFRDSYATPIQYQGKTYFLFYSKTPLFDKSVIKSDPFIGLYLLKSNKETKGYVLRDIDIMAKEMQVAVIGFYGFMDVKILSNQKDFLDYAKLSKTPLPNQIVSNICYQIYGITTEDGLIDKRYIERFLEQKYPYYGDIGIQLRKNTTEVELINPFFEKNPFLPYDKIISIDDVPVTKNDIHWKIANLVYQSEVKVKVQRQGQQKPVELKVRVNRAYGGLLLQDSFFESQGIKIDANLNIRRVYQPTIEELGELKRGDRILRINKIDPLSLSGDIFLNLKKILSDAYIKQGYIEFLVSRNGFDFNLKIYPRGNQEKANENQSSSPKAITEFRSNQ